MWEDRAIKFDRWSRGWTGLAVGDEGATIRWLKSITDAYLLKRNYIQQSSQTIRAATMAPATHVTSLRLDRAKGDVVIAKKAFSENIISLSAICFNTATHVTSLCLGRAKCDDFSITKSIFCGIIPPQSLQL